MAETSGGAESTAMKEIVCRCPVCGETNIDTLYAEDNGNILGCSECIHTIDAWDYAIEREEEEHWNALEERRHD